MFTTKLKANLKWLILAGAIVVIIVLAIMSQSPQVISATVSPEVIVKGQNQEVTVKAIVKPFLFAPKSIRITMSERGYEGQLKTKEDYVSYYSVFKRNPQSLGFLGQAGKDANGNLIYTAKFNVDEDIAQTVQIKLTNYGLTLGSTLLAISTRQFTLPPDPGVAGKVNLEGIDSDKDGLRDDVQREVFFLVPESEKLRMALAQEAKIEQILASQDNLDKKQAYDLVEKESDTGACIYAINVTTEQTLHINYALETKLVDSVTNTLSRKKLENKNIQLSGGHFTGHTDIKRCSFNPADYAD